mmetsp:Transcript_4350/g.6621  ORF Transcript_4350/g.6621 Transcript_4350/m.6621 type:complete len:172 (+) Transcript_4350:134-649(+)
MSFFNLSDSSSSDSEESILKVETDLPKKLPEVLENSDELRFKVEFEFVQMLASPSYLHYLAIHEYFDEDHFLEYLDYLRYWNRTEYKVLLEYPECLHFLDKLVTDPKFRTRLKHPLTSDQLHHEQFYRWRNRLFNIGVPQLQHKQETKIEPNTQQEETVQHYSLHDFPILD